jgi:hypothetical protein
MAIRSPSSTTVVPLGVFGAPSFSLYESDGYHYFDIDGNSVNIGYGQDSFSFWIKVDSWDSASQEIMRWDIVSSPYAGAACNGAWAIQRVGSTDAIQVISLVGGGNTPLTMTLAPSGAIAGSGWRHFILTGFRYAWDGTLYNSDQTAFIPDFVAAPGSTTAAQTLSLSLTPNLSIAHVGSTACIPNSQYASGEDSLVAAIQAWATRLSDTTKAANLGFLYNSYVPLDDPKLPGISGSPQYVYGPPLNAYRAAILTESALVAFLPLDDRHDLFTDSDYMVQPSGSDGQAYLASQYYNTGTQKNYSLSDNASSPGYYTRAYPSNPTAYIEGCMTFWNDDNVQMTVPADPTWFAFTTPFSLEAWVNRNAGSPTHPGMIIAKPVGTSDSAPHYDYSLSLGTDGFYHMTVAIGSTQYEVISTVGYTTNTWDHVVGVYDGSTIRVYVNGALACTPVSVTGTPRTSGQPLSIGGAGSDSYDPADFYGFLSSVALYNAALSSTQVTNHYTAAGPVSPPSTANALVTQVVAESMYKANANALVTQVVAESLYGANSTAFITQVVAEVLRTSDAAVVLNVSGLTTINLAGAALAPQTTAVTAITTIALAPVGSGMRAPKTATVSAINQIVLGHATSRNVIGAGPQIYNASATTAMHLLDAAGIGTGRLYIATAFTGLSLSQEADGGRNSYFNASATTTLNVTNTSVVNGISPIYASAGNVLRFTATAKSSSVNRLHDVSALTTLVIHPQADADGQIRHPVTTSSTGIGVTATASASVQRIVNVSAVSSLNVYSNTHVSGARLVSALTTIGLTATATQNASIEVTAITSLSVTSAAPARSRDIFVSAVSAMGFATDNGSNHFLFPTAIASMNLSGLATATIGWNDARNVLAITDTATASVALPGGGSVPGGDANSGLRAVAYSGTSATFPFSYAETPSGLLLLANGVDPMLRWDGLSGLADTAGVKAPAGPINLAGQDVGTIVGIRYAFSRFVDRNGNYSSFSPLSNPANMGRDAAIENIIINPSTGVVLIASTGHGLITGDAVIFQGITGLPISGGMIITVIDDNTFALTSLRITSGVWTGGGSWTWGINEVVYQNIPTPTEAKVVRRQILRNLDGSADVFYVDIDTTDLLSTTLTSTRSDESLSACESVPLTTDNELPYASRYAVPPSHKSIVTSHMGRIFACGEVAVTAGNVAPRHGSATVNGIGTSWPATLAGRLLYVTGATQSYEIASVNVATQTLTLTAPYLDQSAAYALYAIRPAPGERRLVYYTEPGLPESWPSWNSFAIPEEDDEIVGMFARTGFLYFVEQRHIHRFTMQDEPSEGENFASINRGCINGRCFVNVENTCYLLDEAGIHAFDGGQATEPISTPIQTIFQADGLLGGLMVDWSADPTLWHASHDPVRTTIRWFVQMVAYDDIYHAISYDYRQQRWWIEQYPTAITSSTVGVVGYRRAICGTDARRVIVLGEGSLDLVADAAVGISGTVTDADSTSLTDANANFPANLAGAPVSIVFGSTTGQRRQQSIIAENTAQVLTVVTPWTIVPDQSCTYQVGGVQWSWRSGWFEQMGENEQTNARDVMLTYQPTVNPANIDMQLFYDHSNDPKAWALDIDQDGVSVINGDPNITVNLQTRQCRSGWSLQRFGGHSEVYAYGEQFLQIYLAGVQCAESIRVFQITMNGIRSQEDA